MDVSRKRSFQEPELATARKKLEQGHVYQERRGDRKNVVDSRQKTDSAAHIVHYMENITVKRLTNNLKTLSEKWEQKTLKEMLRSGTDTELMKKVYKNLILVEEQRQELKKEKFRTENKIPVKSGEEGNWTDQADMVEESEEPNVVPEEERNSDL